MNKNTETLVDENGIEVMATYHYDTLEDGSRDTILQSVEFILSGRGCEILLLLNENQKQSIIEKLTYE